MEYLLGLLTAVVFNLLFFAGFYFGRKPIKPLKPPEMDKPTEIDESKEREIKQLQDEFRQLFSYDVNKATERKKV